MRFPFFSNTSLHDAATVSEPQVFTESAPFTKRPPLNDNAQAVGSADEPKELLAPSRSAKALLERAASIRADADEKRAQADEDIARAQDLQSRHAALQRAADLAAERLLTSDSQNFAFTHAVEAMLADLATRGFGAIDGFGAARPVPLSAYSEILAMERAALHYEQQVHPELVERAEAAQAALTEFEESHL